MHRALLSFFVLGLGLLLCADGWGMSQRDSLWVRGGLTLADSMAVDVEWRLGRQDPEGETDTVWTRISRSDALLAWARTDSTQVQLDAPWPTWVDSAEFQVALDSSGLSLRLVRDTLRAPWGPLESGCFPTTPTHEVNQLLQDLGDLPFESKRLDAAVPWLRRHCLSIPDVRRIANLFDDDGRRMSIVQVARITRPEVMPSLVDLFFSSRYKAQYLEWLKGDECPN